MPSAYTSKVLDGTIQTLPDFAKTCMRAFGACIHMRDHALDVKYIPSEPSSYHAEQVKKLTSELKLAQEMSDEDIIKQEEKELRDAIARYSKAIEEIALNKLRIHSMLEKVNKWAPPTHEHGKLKIFMIEQLQSTLEYDGNDSWYVNQSASATARLKTIYPKSLRQDRIKNTNEEIKYHTNKLEEETQQCKSRNKWVTDLLKSFEPESNKQPNAEQGQ